MIKFSLIFIIIFGTRIAAFTQEHSDSLANKNSVKLDLIPFYHVLFDNRVQLRIGLEYERYVFTRSSVSCYLDIGLYDKYNFIKYYDFFNQNQGMYSIQEEVSIAGFHLLPSYNYYFHGAGKKKGERYFFGAITDVGYYHKNMHNYNTLTLDSHAATYNQTKLGMGLSLGFKNNYGNHIFLELKTSLLTKLYNSTTSGLNQIKSLDAQWTSTDYNFWWISNLKIGYAF